MNSISDTAYSQEFDVGSYLIKGFGSSPGSAGYNGDEIQPTLHDFAVKNLRDFSRRNQSFNSEFKLLDFL